MKTSRRCNKTLWNRVRRRQRKAARSGENIDIGCVMMEEYAALTTPPKINRTPLRKKRK